MAYTTVNNPELYFQSQIWTGNETARSITFDGSENMSPNFVWIKIRNQSFSSRMFDSVRGTGKFLYSDTNEPEGTNSATLTSFDSDGFSLGNDTGVNKNSDTFVSWSWKAGTSFSNDASATSVGTIDSTGSISTISGFGVISYTGTGSAGTIAHGISTSAPSMVMTKNREDTSSWNIYVRRLGGGGALFLNDDASFDSDSTYFNNGTASTTTFPVGTANTSNGSSDDMIAYVFSNIQGYQKVGTYKGNGSATDGTYVHLGFRPAFFLVKGSSGTNSQFTGWFLYDNKRSPFNKTNKILRADTNDVEGTSAAINFLSQGIKMKQGSDAMNDVNITYTYYAVAESPFVNENGVPNNAR